MPRTPTGPRAMTDAERQARWRSRQRETQAEVERLRAALERSEGEMRYAAEELRKARRTRQHHTMIAAADDARAALARPTPCHTSSRDQQE